MWPVGTPVMLLGMKESHHPYEGKLNHRWKSVMVGRLEESFSPESSVILENALMPGAIPSRGWSTQIVHRAYEKGASVAHFSPEKRESLIHDSWRNMFLLTADVGTEPVQGCRRFYMIKSSDEVARRIGGGNSSLCDRLDDIPRTDFPSLLGLVPEIIASMEWFLGGYYDWNSAKIDRSGKIIFPK